MKEIDARQLKAAARYEVGFSEVLPDDDVCFADFRMSLTDLKIMLKNARKHSPKEFFDEWFGYVLYSKEIDEALGIPPFVDEEQEHNLHSVDGLLHDDDDVFVYVLGAIAVAYGGMLSEEDEYNLLLDKLEAVIKAYEDNKGRPLAELEYPDDIKEDYIRLMNDQIGSDSYVSDEQVKLFKRYLEELAAKENAAALRIKGYLHYGGSALYPCDWHVSRDCLEKAFGMTKDPDLANTLGYIYYYGRCNDRVPEYEKAFQYFVYGHVHKLYESSYKLADMYKSGKGTFKSEETYAKMIEELYDYAYTDLCEGSDKNFADCALRMGGVYEDLYGEPETAYIFYLQAAYALDRRMSEGRYGDDKVDGYIREALERTRDAVRHRKDMSEYDETGFFLFEFLRDRRTCVADVSESIDGAKIRLSRQDGRKVLITIPECDHCLLAESVTLETKAAIKAGTYLFDSYAWIYDDEGEISHYVVRLDGEDVLELPKKITYRCRSRFN